MKKLLFWSVLLLAAACSADKSPIVKTWLGDAVEVADANSTEAKIAAAAFGSMVKTMKMEFHADGRISTYVMGRERLGKYAISDDKQFLTITFDDGQRDVYELAAISDKDMYLKSSDKKVNLRFVAEGVK